MWIILIFIVFIMACLILGAIKETTEETKEIKCKYCGHEFEYSKSKSVKYKFSGKLEECQECPMCGFYNKIE